MFELVFLGTSSSAPSARRGLSAHLIMHRQRRFLLDCGEGTQRQILQSGLGFKRLNHILLTHGHLDHILGLGGLVSTLARWENLDNINIYGGQRALSRVGNLLFKVVFPGGQTPIDIQLNALQNGVIMEDDKFSLSSFPVAHRGSDSYGFVFEEKARRPFLAEKASELGVPFGPERGQLTRGETITLADGRTIAPDDVLGDLIPGVKYIHTGDIGKISDQLRALCRNADALVIESTYVNEEAEMARQFGHMTAARAAQMAKETGVKSLILTHLSRRYYERQIRKEAQAIFPNTYVARDFDHFQITRDGAVRLESLRPDSF